MTNDQIFTAGAGGARDVIHPSTPRAARGGYTLVEMMVALAIGSVVVGGAMAGIVFLQKSYAATEQYAVNLADQSRLMDYLTLDLRRAVKADAPTTDGSGNVNGLTLYVPGYYTDPLSLNTPNTPRVYMDRAYYSPTVATTGLPPPVKVIYRQQPSFPDPYLGTLFNVITRQEGALRETSVAAGMDAFPEVTFDSAAGVAGVPFKDALRARIKVVFRPRYQTPVTPGSNTFVLHGLTFLRNNDIQQR